jgi:hypothetical protein
MNAMLRSRINRMLGEHGLAQLDDPGLLPQLAFLVRDHDHFRSILVECEPAERANCYNALAPNLRFEAKPLDVYVSEAGQIAEREQQMGWTGDHFEPFMTPEITTTNTVQRLVEQAVAKECLTVCCRRCLKEESFYGTDRWEAVVAAREAGWIYSLDRQVEFCPQYPDCGK